MPPQLASQFTTGELAVVAPGRGRGAGQAALRAHHGRVGGAGRRWDHHRAQRDSRGRRPRLSDHRGAAAQQTAQSRQCRAGRLARMASLDRARPEKSEQWPRKRDADASQGGGSKKIGSTDTGSNRTLRGDRVSRGQLSQNALRKTPNSVLLRT